MSQLAYNFFPGLSDINIQIYSITIWTKQLVPVELTGKVKHYNC